MEEVPSYCYYDEVTLFFNYGLVSRAVIATFAASGELETVS